MGQKSQRLVCPSQNNRNQKGEKSTPRFARAHDGVFSLNKSNDVESHDPRRPYTTGIADLALIGFLIWFACWI